jgi:hypothetical protein
MALGRDIQKQQYGGFNLGSAFFGWIVSVGMEILLIGLFSAVIGAVAVSNGVSLNRLGSIGIWGALMLLLALAVAYYAGGYVAGRMSRFDGGRQGMGVWAMGLIVTLILALAGALLGNNYNVLQQAQIPSIDFSALTAGGLLGLLLGLAVTLVAAIAGGKSGEMYHRRVDAAGEVIDRSAPAAPASTRGNRYQPAFGERIEKTPRDDGSDYR